MNPHVRNFLFALGASVVAVWCGISIAQGEFGLAAMIGSAAIVLALGRLAPQPIETWLLAALLFAYIVGNRGFAQLMPLPGWPLFFGEIGLLVVGCLVAFRGAMRRELPIRRDGLNILLLAWIAVAVGRIAFDVRQFGFLALRDFATIYYAVYFFLAQATFASAETRPILRRAMLAAFGILPVTATLAELFPREFLRLVSIGQVPAIFYKDDLVATLLFAGFLVLLPTAAGFRRGDFLRWTLALASLIVGLTLLSRAGMLGLLAGAGLMAWAGRRRPVKVLAVTVVIGALGTALLGVFGHSQATDTRAYAVYEQVLSIVDLGGQRVYHNVETADSPDNNRFRLVWWRTIAEDTWRNAPLLGRGFGYDLARGFLQVYDPLANDFTARSPHSIVFTVLGRMGLVGLGLFGLFVVVLVRRSLGAARRVRDGGLAAATLALLSAVWVVLVSSAFGVVLEGPMGAVPFWIMLGAAHAMTATAAPVATVSAA